MDIADQHSVEAALAMHGAWAVVNAAGYVRVDEAEQEQDRCYRENTVGPTVLAEVCRSRSIALLTFSSDLVFDGLQDTPYTEDNEPAPLNVYGASKLAAERVISQRCPGALVVRTSAFFGPWDNYNFVIDCLRELSNGRQYVAADDLVVSPTYVPDLVDTSLDLLIDRESGLWHLANEGEVTWVELARRVAEGAGFDPLQVVGRPARHLRLIARRPRYSALASRRARLMPALDHALRRCLEELVQVPREAVERVDRLEA
jgi:dTDP-4-dehydrorhamnose reductase